MNPSTWFRTMLVAGGAAALFTAVTLPATAQQTGTVQGTVTEAGRPSPDRDRPAEESLDLLERMKTGEFEEGAYTLRAKIDYGFTEAKTAQGHIVVQVWINQGMYFEDEETGHGADAQEGQAPKKPKRAYKR